MDFFRRLDLPVPEQVIDVPMISPSSCPSRAVLNEPQVVEQLVEVPTLLSVAVLQQRTAEQLAYIPVPRGRGQGFLPEQSSTAISSSGKRISERTVERIVDISPGGGLGHGSSSSAGPADEDFTLVFRTFPQRKKVRHDLRTRGRHCLRTRAHGHRQLMACLWAVWRSRRRGGRRPSSKRLRLWRGLGCYRTSCSVLLCCWQPQDARHHGRHVPYGQLCCEEAAPVVDAGLACTRLLLLIFHLALCSFSCCQAKVLGILAGMEQKDSYVAYLWPRSLSFKAAACAWLVFLVTILLAVFPSVVEMLKMLDILVGSDQKDSFQRYSWFLLGDHFTNVWFDPASVLGAFEEAHTFYVQMDSRISVQCLVRQWIHAHASDYGGSGVEVAASPSTLAVACALLFVGGSISRAVFSLVGRPMKLGIMAGMAQKDCYSAMPKRSCLDQVVHTPVCATTDAMVQTA